jgi:hypothetical protein
MGLLLAIRAVIQAGTKNMKSVETS